MAGRCAVDPWPAARHRQVRSRLIRPVCTIRVCAIRACAIMLSLAGLVCPAGSGPVIVLYGSSYLEQLSRSLDYVGLNHAHLEDGALIEVPPDSIDALFVAYDLADDPEVVTWLQAFHAAGGRLFTYFLLPSEIQRLTGIRQLEFVSPKYRGQFAQIRTIDVVPNLPPVVHQRSWNIYRVEPQSDSIRVAARWHNLEGQDTGIPALLVGPAGAHLTHVLLDGNPAESGRLYAALLGHFFPETWTQAVIATLDAAKTAGSLQDTDLLHDSRQASAAARQAMAQERHPQALEFALQSRDHALTAMATTLPSRRGEFRGVWLADPEGLSGHDWPQTARLVARSGFNAILARFLGAAEASYPSGVLPADGPSMAGKDRLQTAIRACHAQGLELHVWKVCYKLRTADSVFVDVMRSQNRLQADARGREIAWLCPSHPANRQLELAAAVEVAEEYDIDGLHLDYVRFPHDEACFDDGCRVRFTEQTGLSISHWPHDVIDGPLAVAFATWRTEQITALVREISTRLSDSRPGVKISAAVFPDWPRTRHSLGQDWVQWIEDDYLDFVIPMNYKPDQLAFESLVRRQMSWVDGRGPLYIGIGAWQLRSAEDLLNQINSTRQAGADGFALFQLDHEMAQRTMPLLKRGPTASVTAPPHRGPAVTFTAKAAAASTDSIAGRAYYAVAKPLTLSFRLVDDEDVSWSTSAASIQTLNGAVEQPLGELRQGRRHRWWPFGTAGAEEQLFLSVPARLPSGDYRAVVHGQYRGPQGQDEFLRRGPILRVRSGALLDSLRTMQHVGSPPPATAANNQAPAQDDRE